MTQVIPSSEIPEIVEFYKAQAKSVSDKVGLHPLGKLVCQRWTPPTLGEYDRAAGYKSKNSYGPSEFTFYVEDEVLAFCFPGMKFEDIEIRKIGIKHAGSSATTSERPDETEGIWHIDFVTRVYCSFYTLIPNELELANKPWKNPGPIHSIDVEAMDEMAEAQGIKPTKEWIERTGEGREVEAGEDVGVVEEIGEEGDAPETAAELQW